MIRSTRIAECAPGAGQVPGDDGPGKDRLSINAIDKLLSVHPSGYLLVVF
jgi:hypothetical protein